MPNSNETNLLLNFENVETAETADTHSIRLSY